MLLAIIAIVALANAGFAIALLTGGSTAVLSPRGEQSPRVNLAARLDDDAALVATLANEVLWLERGQPTRQASLPNLIGGLAASPAHDEVYAGTSDGIVTVFDAGLAPRRKVELQGRVVALRPAPGGGFIAAHGIGAFSDRYWVSHYPSGADQPAFSQKVEFTVSSLDTFPDRIAYSTTNARVGVLGAHDGAPLWVTMVTRPATRVAVAPGPDRVIVGDDRGNVTLLNGATGETVWETNVTGFPIRSLAFDADSGSYLVGDTNGGVYALGDLGWTLFSARAAQNSVEAFLPGQGGLVGVPREGAWFDVRPAAMAAAARADQLRLAWLLVDLLLVLLIGAAVVARVPRWRARASRLGRDLRRSRLAYAFILPSLVMISVFSYYPALMAFYLSLTNFSLREVTQFVGLKNYVAVVTTDFYFQVGFGNMLLILATSIVKVLTVPLLTAELVFWVKNHVHRYAFRTLVVFPAVVPDLVATLLWRWMWDPRVGAVNGIFGALGLTGLQRPWLGHESTAIWAIIATGFPFLGAFAFLIYMGGLLNINAELFDSAQIDGAGPWRRFWHVDLPLLEPQLRLLLFFAFAGSIQGFANILIFTRGGPGYATYVPALQMYLQIADGGDFGYASAIGTILFALIFAGTLLIMRVRRPAASGAAS